MRCIVIVMALILGFSSTRAFGEFKLGDCSPARILRRILFQRHHDQLYAKNVKAALEVARPLEHIPEVDSMGRPVRILHNSQGQPVAIETTYGLIYSVKKGTINLIEGPDTDPDAMKMLLNPPMKMKDVRRILREAQEARDAQPR